MLIDELSAVYFKTLRPTNKAIQIQSKYFTLQLRLIYKGLQDIMQNAFVLFTYCK